MRFLKDMLQRVARQVLTAGKADEAVADSGGPLPGHSVFTGHLLQALDGAAATPDGVISAHAVMAYVYDHVAKDPHSQQSPDFGLIEGDGDMILASPELPDLAADKEFDTDVLIGIPANLTSRPVEELEESLETKLKDHLSDPRYRIRLDDLVSSEIRSALAATGETEFPRHTSQVTADDFANRLVRYLEALGGLTTATILIARWADQDNQPLLANVISRMTDNNEPIGGTTLWLNLRWYPTMLLMYLGGIAAIAGSNYGSLTTLLTASTMHRVTGVEVDEAIVPTVEGILAVNGTRMFKLLPGHEKFHVPMNEYLFKALQPRLDDLLYLGGAYEEAFDRFEILYSLLYAEIRNRSTGSTWGPPGRFWWKHVNQKASGPFERLVKEAESNGTGWAPLQHGLFQNSLDRFMEIADTYRGEILDTLKWF